jgi:hypothetical protein
MADNYGSTLRKPPTIGLTATPTVDSPRPVATSATALTSSAEIDLLGTTKQGWITHQAVGQDVYVVFGRTGMAAATVDNTIHIPANTSLDYYHTEAERFCRNIATVIGVYKAVRSS